MFNLLLTPMFAVLGGLDKTRTGIGYNQSDIFVIGGSVAGVAFSFLGVVFVLLIIAAGFMWMTAGGNDTKIKTARQLLTAAVIGLIVIVSAYAISTWLADTFSAPVFKQNP